MREKCSKCGEMEDMVYTWTYDAPVFDSILKFCYNCGNKIEEGDKLI